MVTHITHFCERGNKVHFLGMSVICMSVIRILSFWSEHNITDENSKYSVVMFIVIKTEAPSLNNHLILSPPLNYVCIKRGKTFISEH